MEDGKWYGMWAGDESEFKLAQETLMSTYGIKEGLEYPYQSYAINGGVWVLCKKGRGSLAFRPETHWNHHMHGDLVEVQLPNGGE